MKNIYVKHRASTRTSQAADAIDVDQILSLQEQRAAICHVLLTSEPLLSSFLGVDQRAQTYGQNSCGSGEEMIFQVWAKICTSVTLTVSTGPSLTFCRAFHLMNLK